ncbi:MAG TPA: TAXI family TRAP transporter solute-binding subunit [Terriglobales bacterium]|nr:TAXI family TRAP transporter solute-binding subunit [Terriglobales bacterium]
MAVYPEGTLNAELAKRYREILARDGVDLKLVPAAGAVESVARLRDPKSGVSVALIPGGITTKQDSPELVSLGTLFYQPLWVFSRDHLLKRHKQLRDLRISVGPEGSSSRALALDLLGQRRMIDMKSTALSSFTPSESAQKLIQGEIDVAIFLEGWESPAVQQLLKAKNVTLENISRADAYASLFPFLNKLVLPAGVVDVVEPRPPTDTVLIAPKSSLVIRKDLHPAIQYLLLEAAVEIHSTPGMFRTVGQFPAPESIDLPLSPHALEFYKAGAPFLQRHLPFWLALLIEEPVVWLIPLFIVLFPLFRLAPSAYDWFERRRVYKLYGELKRLEDEMLLAAPSGSHQDYVERLNRLEGRASHLSVPTPFRPLVYGLRLHIGMVRQQIEKYIPPEPQSSRRHEPIES